LHIAKKDNRKEIDDKKRRFILSEELCIFENSEPSIEFEFSPGEDKRTQKQINELVVESIYDLREKTKG